MSLREVIAPEITCDSFADELTRIAREEKIATILEIGSSSGDGSTAAWVRGLLANPVRPRLFCLEVSRERFAVLKARYAAIEEVHCYNCTSVTEGEVLTEDEVRAYHLPNRELYPVEKFLEWRAEEVAYVAKERIGQGGIGRIKREHGIDTFDAVLIDGSEFTGDAEWRHVDGARFVLLDDINTLKNHRNFTRLLRDPRYELIRRDTSVRNGFAVFRKARTDLPIQFFTIVLNGRPFIERHFEVFQQLTVPWKWHIVEGAAELVGDTAWSAANGGHLPAAFHNNGLSTDGTTTYLNALQAAFPDQVTVSRRTGGGVFAGKTEMIRAIAAGISDECLLWQVDVDEFWTPEQIHEAHRMFMEDGSRTAAYYLCDFHVGPGLVTTTLNTYASHMGGEWLRTWRFRPGMQWLTHEPPRLMAKGLGPDLCDVAHVNPFAHHETAARGLVFRHEAYVAESQLRFKEDYYGYKNAVAGWKALQKETKFPVPLRQFLGWVNDETLVDRAETGAHSIKLARRREQIVGERGSGAPAKIVIDGIFYQRSRQSGIAQVWTNLLGEWAKSEFGSRLVVIDRGRTAPRIDGIEYCDLARHDYANLELDRNRVESVCRFHEAGLFISSYYSRPVSTPSLLFAHDMIPERGWFDLRQPMWLEKALAIQEACAYAGNSRTTLEDLDTFHPAARGKPRELVTLSSRLKRAEPGAQALFRQRLQLSRPYFLLVGPSTYYKNAGFFFEGLARLHTRGAFDVVCAHAHGLEKWRGEFSIREFSFSDADLAAAYSAAEALVFPSVIEGFGLPLVEAMNCGCPVIALRTPVHEEVCGDAALYCEKGDPLSLTRHLAAVQDESFREELVNRGYERARRYSWAESAIKFRRFIEGVLAGNREAAEAVAAGS